MAFEKLNKVKVTIKDGIDTEGMEFKPLKDFCGKKIEVDGFFFTKGNYGKEVVVVGSGYLINMPKRAVEQFEELRDDEELLALMLDGHLMIKNIKKKDCANGTTTIYDLADC